MTRVTEYRPLPPRRRIHTTPRKEAEIAGVAKANVRGLRSARARLTQGGAHGGVRVDTIHIWTDMNGDLVFMAGPRAAAVRSAGGLSYLANRDALRERGERGAPQATALVVYKDFSGRAGIDRVVWRRERRNDLDWTGRRVLAATEARFRGYPEESSQSSLEANGSLDPE
jgi:hypothetical protein